MEQDETDHSGNSFNDYEQMVSRIAEEKRVAISCLRFAVADLKVPAVAEMVKIQDAITEGIEAGKPVNVHCWGEQTIHTMYRMGLDDQSKRGGQCVIFDLFRTFENFSPTYPLCQLDPNTAEDESF